LLVNKLSEKGLEIGLAALLDVIVAAILGSVTNGMLWESER